MGLDSRRKMYENDAMKKYFLILSFFLLLNFTAFAQNETTAPGPDALAPTALQQVHIEAKVVQITLDEEHRVGVDWAAIVSNYQSLDFKEAVEYFKGNDSAGRLSFGTISNDDYTILLEALDTVGMMEVLSNPSTSTPEGKAMTIAVESLQPKMTTTTTTTFFGWRYLSPPRLKKLFSGDIFSRRSARVRAEDSRSG